MKNSARRAGPSVGRGTVLLSALLASVAPTAAAQRAGQPAPLRLEQVENGFGPLLPHQVFELDANGLPTNQLVELRTLDELLANVRPTNPVRAIEPWPAGAELPGGAPGNHYLVVRFERALDLGSVMTAEASTINQLSDAVRVYSFNGLGGNMTDLRGRVFVGGKTHGRAPVRAAGAPSELPLQRWVYPAGGGLVANPEVDNDGDGVPDGLGFPGTESALPGELDLADDRTLVFVVDTDFDLSTHESFPPDVQIVLTLSTDVRAADGAPLAESAFASATVRADTLPPEVPIVIVPPSFEYAILPPNGATDVDPLTTVQVGFTEPVQPFSVGPLRAVRPPDVGGALRLTFGPGVPQYSVPYDVLPLGAFRLDTYVLRPAFAFPGSGDDGICDSFSRIQVEVQPGHATDLADITMVQGVHTFFDTGPGPTLVNAPVTPDAIYVARFGPGTTGLSVIDLNGFGASTGDPTYDPANPVVEGNSNYPNNPNVSLQGSLLRPPLTPGLSTHNGGASGVFRPTLDTCLDSRLTRAPVMMSVGDMALGHGLDLAFNNGPPPFGCQAGGGNLCAVDPLKRIELSHSGGNTLVPTPNGAVPLQTLVGGENTVSFAPHPNPPPIVFPPLCAAPFLPAQEPTSVYVLPPPDGVLGLQNLLVPGDPFGNPGAGVPPSGLLSPEQNSWFQGPAPPAATPAACLDFMVRQKIGQFLYVVDRARGELVVLDSNLMRALDRIPLPDPVELAMSPELDLIAVSSQATDEVHFVDVDPSSPSFHQVVHVVAVGDGPRGIAWEPGNEDVLVCCEADGSLAILSAFSLQVRKTVTNLLHEPFAVAITPRQDQFGFLRDVYFAYVLDRTGRVAIFESGPAGAGGQGYDDVIGLAPQTFHAPRAVQPDPLDLRSAAWIAHEGAIDPGTGAAGPPGTPALTKLFVDSSATGVVPIDPGQVGNPQFRSMDMTVELSLDATQLSGIPSDIAFDDQRNLAGLENYHTAFSAGPPVASNGKNLVREVQGVVHNTNEANYLFASVPGAGVVDVIQLVSGIRIDVNAFHPGVQSIALPGARRLMSYFRQ